MNSSENPLTPNRPTPDPSFQDQLTSAQQRSAGITGPSLDVASQDQISLKRLRRVILVALAMSLFGMFAASKQVQAAWQEIGQMLSLQGKPEPASPAVLSEHEIEDLDRLPAQRQAELLLERAINHYDGATDQVAARVDRWYGKIKITTQFNSLFATAINSNDLRVRATGLEIDLAAYNVPKVPQSVDLYKPQTAPGSPDRVTAMWVLGLLGNRGVEPDRVREILLRNIHDPEQNIRYWAVESLALLGTDEIIQPLLGIFHDDPSPAIRERAACSLAQSGMLSQEQRRKAIPQLLDFADDAALDAQTHSWVFQALRDITGQNLSNDAASWRNWYSSQGH